MSSPIPRIRRFALAVTAIAVLGVVGAGSASAIPASPVSLNWTQANVFNTAPPANTNKTWLGYITGNAGNGSPAGAGGTAVASGAASGATVDTSSTRGASSTYTFGFPATGGSLDATTLAGSLDFGGTVTYTALQHGFSLALTDPVININSDKTGTLTASGVMNFFVPGDTGTSAGPPINYTAGTVVFNLDLSKTTCTFNYDGSLTLGNIVPSIASDGGFFPGTSQPGGYPAGAGPDRTPNTFGSFSISHAICAPLTGPKGDTGAQGPQGPAGKDGKDASSKTFIVKKRVFKTNKTVVAKVTKSKKFVGYATVKGRKIKLTYITDSIKGTYKFSPLAGKLKPVKVKLG